MVDGSNRVEACDDGRSGEGEEVGIEVGICVVVAGSGEKLGS